MPVLIVPVAENLQEVVMGLLDFLPPAVVGLAMTRPAAIALVL
ncbi:hypothetical protein ACWCV9_29925 [Streptomyces sp. NPDC001606]